MSAEEADIDLTRYTIISKIGEGSFSKVYRVKDSKTNKSYAAKVCKFMVNENTQDSEEARLLFREVNLMSLLNHPSVLKFVGYYSTNFDDDPLPTIITELAVNGSLRDIIRMEGQGLSPSEWNHTKKLINIYGIAAGMSYLHAHNVLHRDLKPENILVDEYLHPKISDFGLSKITDFLSASMNFQSQRGTKGTPAYMAPEIMSEEKYSKSGDVYAFGFIVYEIMTCDESFKNCDIYKLMKKVMNEGYRPEISEDVPDVYRELIEKCWSQKSEERPSFDEIVSEMKTNNEFISEHVDETEYYDYVDFIDNYRSTFDVNKRTIHFSDFIKRQGRNKEIKPILIETNLSEEEKNSEIFNKEENEFSNISNETEKKDEPTQNKQTSSNESQQKINEIKNKPLKINENENSQLKVNENENNPSIINDNEDINTYQFIYPLEEFNKLSKNNQNLVEMSAKDIEKSFEVGKFLIEGKNGFPNNIELGIKYIEHSANKKCVDAIVYYIEVLIKGKIIREDLTKADEYLTQLSQLLNSKDSRLFLLRGLMSYKKNKFKEAATLYSEGIKLGDPVCMYKYGKMLFIGEGTEKNNNESIKNFINSNELGYSKSGYFLSSLNSLNKIKHFSKLASETQMIFIMNNIKNKANEQESEFKQILLSPRKTEKLFFNKSMKLVEFYECLKQYQHINIELEYPSESFKSILDLVIKIHKKHHKGLNIGVVFSSFEKEFTKECFSTDISYHRIDSSIHNIPSEAFKECSSLVQITIPSSVTQIGNFTFYGCSSLKQITIPSSVTQIGGGIFNRCFKLIEITIPSDNESKFEYFEGKFFISKSNSSSDTLVSLLSFTSNIDSITVPPFIKIIGNSAFYGCSSLKQITIPSSITQIGDSAFGECSSLTKITIPSSVTKIGDFAFSYCSSLKQITIPSSVTQIGDYAFSGCSSLIQITIPSFVTRIGDYAFDGCSSLKQITIPSSVTSIGYSAFDGCSSLTQITIPSSVTQIGDFAFSYCSSLKQITIPSSVIQIGKDAFSGCSSLTQITIPSSVTQIGNFAFSLCSSLKQITIPSSITKIGDYAFFKCSSLKQITIPSSVARIGDMAFDGCSSLKQITIPSSLTKGRLGLGSKVKIIKIKPKPLQLFF